MILSCNSCGKKFVVPDNAIGPSGRLVQCSSCGNKWKQFPLKAKVEEKPKTIINKKSITKSKSKKRKAPKKTREINLYSPEYLAKKHGIKLEDPKPVKSKVSKVKNSVSFGFYSSLLLFLVLIIFISRTLYFSQDFIIQLFPSAEFYLGYFFENIRNIFEIWKDLVTNY